MYVVRGKVWRKKLELRMKGRRGEGGFIKVTQLVT
jgi:hypothetical protein